jgi:SNF2 family DNA or RNA helicase
LLEGLKDIHGAYEYRKLQNLLMQLRKRCNHLYVDQNKLQTPRYSPEKDACIIRRSSFKSSLILNRYILPGVEEDPETVDIRRSAGGRKILCTPSITVIPGVPNTMRPCNTWFSIFTAPLILDRYMFPGAEEDPGSINEEIVQASGKMQVMDRLLTKLKAAGHRVVLFSQFTEVSSSTHLWHFC